MIEIVIHGRGGAGGVTLAKLIAGAYFLRGDYVQAFGVYGAERAGAPVRAYVRADRLDIALTGPIARPDHVVVLDPSLLAPGKAPDLKANGWLILNSAIPPEALARDYPGFRVAAVDASSIAAACRLGTATRPIVNTAVFGAVLRVLDMDADEVGAALANANFSEDNLTAAMRAFGEVRMARTAAGRRRAPSVFVAPVSGFFDPTAGSATDVLTGDWASQRPSTRRLTAPCTAACPAGNDVRGFLQAAAEGNYRDALGLILETSPLPGVCGRVCPAPCITDCNRRDLDQAVNVRAVEREIAEWDGPLTISTAALRHEEVAVVGAGPAGLSAAYHLAREGFPVTVFEAVPKLGGLLRNAIPSYRLPPEVLDRDIARILSLGVRIETRRCVDRRELVRLAEEYAAVLVATGRQLPREPDFGKSRSHRLLQSLEFLELARHGDVTLGGERVVVVGGGNTAVDSARTALRLGAAEVTILYRRTREEMPALAEEVEEGLEEGMLLKELLLPLEVRRAAETMELVCRRMRPGDRDESGRRMAVPLGDDDALPAIPCDRILLALGQSPDRSLLPGSPAADGLVGFDEDLAPIFIAGDLFTQTGTVAAAIGSGRVAAHRIASKLLGSQPRQLQDGVVASPDVVLVHRFPRIAQHQSEALPPAERRQHFSEVQLGLARSGERDPAVEEAARCLSCGACTGCGTCAVYCPENVLTYEPECAFDYDYCKGCGLCASECPRGAIVMESCSGVVR
jgi:2-oxoacid:acceptor oxidoreductase gamma subunit (pyruvate/2-ketoisovalerate family)